MVIYENLGNGLVRAYSDQGVKIHGGLPESDYDITYFPEDTNRTYVETNIPLDQPISEYIDGPKQYSKLKILLAAKEAGFLDELVAFIEGNKTVEFIWNASNVIEDNELLASYIPDISQAIGRDERHIKAFLDAYCAVD